MRYKVGAAGANFEINIQSPRLLALLTDVLKALPEDDFQLLCQKLTLIRAEPTKVSSRSWAVTHLLPSGKFEIVLWADLAARGDNFIKGCIAHELGHVVSWAESEYVPASEIRADTKAAEWGFTFDGYGSWLGG
jgi:hypothetical protein